MKNDRNAKWVDVQNFMYEINQMWLRTNDAVDAQYNENGKDSTYYMLLGKQDGIKDAKTLLEKYINGAM